MSGETPGQACGEPHPADYRCFDCATDDELAAAIPPAPASQARRTAEQQGAPGLPDLVTVDLQTGTVTVAPELAAAMAENRQLRNWLDDFTHLVLDLGEARVAHPAAAVRKKAGLPPVTE